jgi:hypothetical protein
VDKCFNFNKNNCSNLNKKCIVLRGLFILYK